MEQEEIFHGAKGAIRKGCESSTEGWHMCFPAVSSAPPPRPVPLKRHSQKQAFLLLNYIHPLLLVLVETKPHVGQAGLEHPSPGCAQLFEEMLIPSR